MSFIVTGGLICFSVLFRFSIRLYVYQDPRERPTVQVLLCQVGQALSDRRVVLLAPMAALTGLAQGFFLVDFTKVSLDEKVLEIPSLTL